MHFALFLFNSDFNNRFRRAVWNRVFIDGASLLFELSWVKQDYFQVEN